jgi:phosphoenolpyruvate synthase/pyruvate phosphate dikinase
MGVVVQEMVPAETAGVLFTRHPFSGNPRQLVITANYGLGEVNNFICSNHSLDLFSINFF